MRNYQLADKPGRTKNWRSEDFTCGGTTYRRIWHYSTCMLEFVVDTKQVSYYHTGHGSASDQQTMNQFFARIGAPYYFSRKGGAEIVKLDQPQYRYGISA